MLSPYFDRSNTVSSTFKTIESSMKNFKEASFEPIKLNEFDWDSENSCEL